MIIVQAPNEELIKSVADDREKLAKQAQDALDANEKEAKEIEKNHGEDTKPVKKIVADGDSKKQLKAMHLSEALFEDYNGDEYYFAVVNACDIFKDGDMSLDELIDELTYIKETMNSGEEKDHYEIPGFEDTKELWDKLNPFIVESLTEALTRQMTPEENKMVNKILSGPYKDIVEIAFGPATFGDGKALPKELMEFVFDFMLNKMYPSDDSITEELSQKGQKVLDELKKELGPDLQKKVAYVIKDYADNSKNPQKKEDKELSEGWSVFHESDIPEEGTLFDDEDSARKFQQEMGEGWEVKLVTK